MHELLAHIEDAHLVYRMPMWTPSVARRQSNPNKGYPVDPALSRTAAFAKPADVGHRLENLVYIELRRRGFQDLGYYQTNEGYEVDFCGTDALGQLTLVQVCADLSDADTRHREYRALYAAMKELGITRASLVTVAESGQDVCDGNEIQITPAWIWLLRDAVS